MANHVPLSTPTSCGLSQLTTNLLCGLGDFQISRQNSQVFVHLPRWLFTSIKVHLDYTARLRSGGLVC